MSSTKIYFPNLNGLRFLAAFLVIIHHIEQIKSFLPVPNYWLNPFVLVVGRLGVILFFVLSGFLITYLLLAEENRFKTISVRKFYIRRLLRIWPLYYLIVFLALAVLPQFAIFALPGFSKELVLSDIGSKASLFAVFLPNLVIALYGIIPYAAQTWSLGAEEQFYLIWPLLLKKIKTGRVWLMVSIILFYWLFYRFLEHPLADFIPFKKILYGFWSNFSIDCMAIGGVFAVLYFKKSPLLKYLLHNGLFYVVLVVCMVIVAMGIKFSHFHDQIYATLFGIIVLNFAVNKTQVISLENKYLNYLGNISYGLYMYHWIAIVTAIRVLEYFNLVGNRFLYPFSLVLTIIIAGLSYRYFEGYFLKFKPKFTKIESGQ